MSDKPQPLSFFWDGDHMVPLNRYSADRMYVVGERYKLAVHEERSSVSHRHLFAALDEAWSNLPHHLAIRFPTSDGYRKYILIKAGHCTEIVHICDSFEDARKMKILAEELDEYVLAITEGKILSVFRAKSLSYKNLSGEEFQRVKSKCLELAAADIGVTVEELARSAGQSA